MMSVDFASFGSTWWTSPRDCSDRNDEEYAIVFIMFERSLCCLGWRLHRLNLPHFRSHATDSTARAATTSVGRRSSWWAADRVQREASAH
eukprot:9485838-Pyramimonas_sp.AAC.3